MGEFLCPAREGRHRVHKRAVEDGSAGDFIGSKPPRGKKVDWVPEADQSGAFRQTLTKCCRHSPVLSSGRKAGYDCMQRRQPTLHEGGMDHRDRLSHHQGAPRPDRVGKKQE